MSVPWMSDNRPAAADDRSLVRVPCRWCVATGGALSSVGRGAFARGVCGSFVGGRRGVFVAGVEGLWSVDAAASGGLP